MPENAEPPSPMKKLETPDNAIEPESSDEEIDAGSTDQEVDPAWLSGRDCPACTDELDIPQGVITVTIFKPGPFLAYDKGYLEVVALCKPTCLVNYARGLVEPIPMNMDVA